MIIRCTLIFILLHSIIFSKAQVRLVAFAGPQVTSAHYKINDIKQPAQFKPGAMAGVALKVPFDNQLYFFPSVYYSLKGYKVTLNNPSFPPSVFAKNNNTTIHTIELSPLLHFDLNKKASHPFIRFGPAIDIAVSGKEKFDSISISGITTTVNRSMVFSYGDYGRLSASANLHFGYQTKNGLMFFAFYQHGIGSMNNADNGPRIFHRIAGVSLGWMFAKE